MLHEKYNNIDPFDNWYSELFGGTGALELEGDVDECEEDLTFNDVDLY